MVEPHEQCAESTKMEDDRNVSETPAPADEQTHAQPEVCIFTPFFFSRPRSTQQIVVTMNTFPLF